ncbi:MAG: YHS domain-containing (seleno)protein [Pseudomonadota bacterium]
MTIATTLPNPGPSLRGWVAVAFTLFLSSAVFAAEDPIYTGLFSKLAVQGHDVVAYFTEGRPVKGSSAFSTEHQGAEFRFASQANLNAFLANPPRYAPQYGGYCAWAVSQGYTAKGSAKHWRIVDDKLYLNYNASVQKTWETDIPGFIQAADTNWPRVLE